MGLVIFWPPYFLITWKIGCLSYADGSVEAA